MSNIFSRVLVPVTIVFWDFEFTEYSLSFASKREDYLIGEPCNPFLSFFGLLRFDKNAKNFRPRMIMTFNKKDFFERCQEYKEKERSLQFDKYR